MIRLMIFIRYKYLQVLKCTMFFDVASHSYHCCNSSSYVIIQNQMKYVPLCAQHYAGAHSRCTRRFEHIFKCSYFKIREDTVLYAMSILTTVRMQNTNASCTYTNCSKITLIYILLLDKYLSPTHKVDCCPCSLVEQQNYPEHRPATVYWTKKINKKHQGLSRTEKIEKEIPTLSN